MRWSCLLPLALLLGGCGSEEGPIAAGAAVVPKIADLGEPKLDTPNPLKLVAQEGNLMLGASRVEAMKAFPKPELANPISDLPKPLREQSGYSAESWQEGNFGFGVILYGDRLAQATRTIEKMTEDQFRVLVEDTRKADGNEQRVVAGRFSRYYFWQSGNQRLMICGFRSPDSSWDATMAIGEQKIMDALGMSEERANADKDSADATLQDYYLKTNKELPPKPPAATAEPSPSAPSGGFLNGLGGSR